MSVSLIKFVARFFALLPLPLTHFIGTFIGGLFYLLPNDLRRITRINLRLCFPGLDRRDSNRLLRLSLIETVKSALEIGPMLLWDKQRNLALVRKVQGKEILQEAMQKGKGVILAAPHLGMWEMVGLYCSAHYPMTSLFRPSRMPAMDHFVHHGRERFGARLVPTDASGIRALYKALDKGELAAILPDQDPRWGKGVFVPFFGTPAYSMTLLSRLAAKSGATVVFAYAERLPRGKGYILHFHEAPPACRDRDITKATQCIMKGVEDCVRMVPQQYQWGYKRFRTRPDGEPAFY